MFLIGEVAIGKNNIIMDDAHGFCFKSRSSVADSLRE